jgi:hypothetical protein
MGRSLKYIQKSSYTKMSEDKKCVDYEFVFNYMSDISQLPNMEKWEDICFPGRLQGTTANGMTCKFEKPKYICIFLKDESNTKLIEMTSLIIESPPIMERFECKISEDMIRMTHRNMRMCYDKNYEQKHTFMICVKIGSDIRLNPNRTEIDEFQCFISPFTSGEPSPDKIYWYHVFPIY